MLREIKFRAWDKTQGVMIENVKIDEIGHACWYSGSVCQVSPFVMQFTGLKDKNGKEIYEGDILKNSYRSGVTEVVWREKEAQYNIGGYHNETIEVIGNIYENPELIENP